MPRKGEKEKTNAGKTRRKPRVKPRTVTVGTPNTAEAPGAMRRFFRFSQLAVGEAGAGRKIEDIWATFLQELDDLGVPAEARSRIEALGATKVLGGKSKGLPESVVKLAGGKENVTAIKETQRVARQALKGLDEKALTGQWDDILARLAKDEQFADANGRRILKELRAISPKTVARVGAAQTMSALARRGDDPVITRIFNKVMRRPGLPSLPVGIQETLKAANEGRLPKVTAAGERALTKAGVKGLGVGRKIAGLAGRSALGAAGAGLLAAFEIGRAKDILGRESRAKKLALEGYQGLGPASSVDFLRDVVRKQEAIARRKVVMQRFEPELFQEVVRVLSDTGQSKSTLTSTERRIGANAEVGAMRRGRSPEDVQFLLDQLFSQMGQ